MLQNLSSAAVVLGALRVKMVNSLNAMKSCVNLRIIQKCFIPILIIMEKIFCYQINICDTGISYCL